MNLILISSFLNLNLEKLRAAVLNEGELKPKEEENEDKEFEREENKNENGEENEESPNENEKKKLNEEELNDEIDSLYYGSSYSGSRRSEVSRRSQLTSATYISQLEKELQEERRAREKLAEELEEIKRISSEISSHLGLKQALENK